MLLLFLLSSFQALAKGRYDDAIEELLDVGACARRALNVRRALWYRLLQRSDLILSHGKALACKRLSRISRGISTWSCIPTLSSHHLACLPCIRPRSRWRHCPWLAHTVSTDPEHRIQTQRFGFIGSCCTDHERRTSAATASNESRDVTSKHIKKASVCGNTENLS